MGEYKFQSLQVYQIALDYLDQVYDLLSGLPDREKFNLRSQLVRAATSIALNIAEGSTGQSNKEQIRFLNLSIRSFLETAACLDICQRRNFCTPEEMFTKRKTGKTLFYKLIRFKKSLQSE
jgi:four helix bundle protein